MFRALGRYNGSLGKSEYPNAVFSAANQFQKELKWKKFFFIYDFMFSNFAFGEKCYL